MNSYIVMGLGRFGQSLAKTLVELGHDVLGVDNNEQLVQKMAEALTHVISADCSDEDFLNSLGIKNFDAAVVAMGNNIQVSILTTTLLKDLGAKYVLAKATNDLHAKALKKVGADRVVFPERDMGVKAANTLASHNILDIVQLSNEYSIMETQVPLSWVGKAIGELAVRAKYKVNILAIKRDDGLTVNPPANLLFNNNDIVSLMGSNKDLQNLQNLKKSKFPKLKKDI